MLAVRDARTELCTIIISVLLVQRVDRRYAEITHTKVALKGMQYKCIASIMMSKSAISHCRRETFVCAISRVASWNIKVGVTV